MKNLNKTLKLATILSTIAILLNGVVLYLDVSISKASTFYIIWDIVSIVLTVASAVTYFVFMRKTQEQIISHRAVFMTLAILNIMNNFIVWAISFWVEIAVNQARQQKIFKSMFSYNKTSQEEYVPPEDGLRDETVYVDDMEITRQKETLVSRLEELKRSKDKNLISEKEYEDLRLEAINKFMNNN